MTKYIELGIVIFGMIALLGIAGCSDLHVSDPELATVYDSPAEESTEPKTVIVDGMAIGDTLQLPEYPAGCEIVTLMNALEHFDIEMTFDETYALFDKSTIDFVNAWWGDPYTQGAAYPPAMVNAAKRAVAGTDIQVRDMTDETLEGIFDTVVTRGGVAIIWYTTDHESPRWTSWEVDGYYMYENEHCAVVYFMSNGTLYISDSLEGLISMEVSEFNKLWEACGSMAVAMYEE